MSGVTVAVSVGPLSPVYTIQPVVKPVVNRFDNRPNVCIHDTTGCQSGFNRLCRVYKHSTGCQTRLTTGFTTGCIVYTAGCQSGCTTRFDNRLNKQWLFIQDGCQTVWQPAVQPVLQPVVPCKRDISRRLYERSQLQYISCIGSSSLNFTSQRRRVADSTEHTQLYLFTRNVIAKNRYIYEFTTNK